VPDTTSAPLSRAKRACFVLLLLGCLAVVGEGGSYGCLRYLRGQRGSLAALQTERLGLCHQEVAVNQAFQADGKLIAHHPYLGFVYCPTDNSPAFRQIHGRGINSFGFIDDGDPIQQRGPDKVIVGILGGSVAFWFSAHGAPALAAELKKSPRFASKEIVFVCAAMGGFKEPQQLLAFNYLLALGAQFDLVLNIDGFNDLVLPACANVPQGINPFFPYNWGPLCNNLADADAQKMIGELAYLTDRRQSWAKYFSGRVLRRSPTAQLIWKTLDRHYEVTLGQKRLALQNHHWEGMSYQMAGPPHPFASEEAMYRELAQVWKRASLQIGKLCAGSDIRYFHFLQPNQYVAGSKPMGEAERKLAYDPNHPCVPHVQKGYPRLIEEGRDLKNQGERFFDLTQAFAGVQEPLYCDNMCHLNPRGSELLAEKVAQAILASYGEEPRNLGAE
jgi:hypothetical protein